MGAMAIQFAKNIGCWVATTSSPRNRDFVAQYGVDKVIDYTTSNWWEDAELMGIDCIFDAIGENDLFVRANGVVREGGSIVSIVSKLSGFEEHRARYSYIDNFVLHHSGEQLKTIADMIVAGTVKVPMDETFSFDEAGLLALYRKQDSGKSNGKNILRIL